VDAIFFQALLEVAASPRIISNCNLLQIGFVLLKELFLLCAGSVDLVCQKHHSAISRAVQFRIEGDLQCRFFEQPTRKGLTCEILCTKDEVNSQLLTSTVYNSSQICGVTWQRTVFENCTSPSLPAAPKVTAQFLCKAHTLWHAIPDSAQVSKTPLHDACLSRDEHAQKSRLAHAFMLTLQPFQMFVKEQNMENDNKNRLYFQWNCAQVAVKPQGNHMTGGLIQASSNTGLHHFWPVVKVLKCLSREPLPRRAAKLEPTLSHHETLPCDLQPHLFPLLSLL
jgi:hypothetical protein